MKVIITVFLLIAISSCASAQNWDINTLRNINLNRNKSLNNSMKFIYNTVAPLAFGAPIILYAVGYLQKDSITKQKAIYMDTTVIISAIISTFLKKL